MASIREALHRKIDTACATWKARKADPFIREALRDTMIEDRHQRRAFQDPEKRKHLGWFYHDQMVELLADTYQLDYGKNASVELAQRADENQKLFAASGDERYRNRAVGLIRIKQKIDTRPIRG